MADMGRRAARAFGFAPAVSVSAAVPPTAAFAQRDRPDEGRDIAPGVRRVDLTKRASEIPADATVAMRDLVDQPGAMSERPAMASDTVCHGLKGELQVSHGPDKQFVAKTGDVWSCTQGMPEADVNPGSATARMRVIDLLPRRN